MDDTPTSANHLGNYFSIFETSKFFEKLMGIFNGIASVELLEVTIFNTLHIGLVNDPRFNIRATRMFHGKQRFDYMSFENIDGEICYGQALLIFSIMGEDMVYIRQFKSATLSEISAITKSFDRIKVQQLYGIYPMILSENIDPCILISATKIHRAEHVIWFDSKGCKCIENVTSPLNNLFGVVNSLVHSSIFHSTK